MSLPYISIGESTMGTGPSDKETYQWLKDQGFSGKEISRGKHAANDDMQEEGWLPERAMKKYLEKHPEDNGGGWVEVKEDDEDDEDTRKPSGGCFIATATLQGNYSESVLIPLKDWRYRIMESSRFGMYLSNNYRQFAPKIAYQISDMPKASEFLRKFFVFPAIKLSKNPGFVSNLLLWIIFFIGSISARILVFIKMRFF